MDRVSVDAHLESRQIKLCATCFDLYHGLARALEMTLHLAPTLLTKPEACDNQNELLLGRTCQVSRIDICSQVKYWRNIWWYTHANLVVIPLIDTGL